MWCPIERSNYAKSVKSCVWPGFFFFFHSFSFFRHWKLPLSTFIICFDYCLRTRRKKSIQNCILHFSALLWCCTTASVLSSSSIVANIAFDIFVMLSRDFYFFIAFILSAHCSYNWNKKIHRYFLTIEFICVHCYNWKVKPTPPCTLHRRKCERNKRRKVINLQFLTKGSISQFSKCILRILCAVVRQDKNVFFSSSFFRYLEEKRIVSIFQWI